VAGGAQVVACNSSYVVFVNGQVSRDADGATVAAHDVAGQCHQTFKNVRHALQAAGLDGADVVQYRVSIVDYAEADLAHVDAARSSVFSDSPIDAAGAIVGVTALGRRDYLVEVEAVAAAETVAVAQGER
jgi:enamine deaminase RidA (YjgF/YER057c/UK114 family)